MRIVIKNNDELKQFVRNLKATDRAVNAIRTHKGIETYTNIKEYRKRCKRFPNAVQGKLTPYNIVAWYY